MRNWGLMFSVTQLLVRACEILVCDICSATRIGFQANEIGLAKAS